jgi:hypothetical protein
MNSVEVGNLLGLMALADNRKPPEDDEGRKAMIEFWLRMVGDLTYADAAQAVTDYYRHNREWIMPSDIRERVEAVRWRRLRENPPPDCPPEIAAQGHDAYVQWHREHGRAIINNEPAPRQIGDTP